MNRNESQWVGIEKSPCAPVAFESGDWAAALAWVTSWPGSRRAVGVPFVPGPLYQPMNQSLSHPAAALLFMNRVVEQASSLFEPNRLEACSTTPSLLRRFLAPRRVQSWRSKLPLNRSVLPAACRQIGGGGLPTRCRQHVGSRRCLLAFNFQPSAWLFAGRNRR